RALAARATIHISEMGLGSGTIIASVEHCTAGEFSIVPSQREVALGPVDTRDSPRTGSMVAAAVQWAERILPKIDNVTSDEKCKENLCARDRLAHLSSLWGIRL